MKSQMVEHENAGTPEKVAAGNVTTPIEILFGSQTGNTEGVAAQLGAAARSHGLEVNITDLNEFGVERLADVPLALILTSTYNEGGNDGDMPDNAELFWKALAADDAPRLAGLRYAVLALGDESYFDFCHAGVLIDERLEELGAARIADRVDCDAFYEEPAEAWIVNTVALLAEEFGGTPATTPIRTVDTPGSEWNRRHAFQARVLRNKVLTGPSSTKEVRHIELDIAGSEIQYTPGDSISIQPVNDPALMAAMLARFGLRPGDDANGKTLEFRMLHEWEIRTPSPDLLAAIAERDPESELATVLRADSRSALEDWLYGRDVLDLLEASPNVIFSIAELSTLFRPLLPRQFSIASSPLENPDRVHLTVATVRYGTDRAHGGVATTYLADRVDPGQTVRVFPQPNATFSLPDDPTAPIIMIGPGTGIAPFRGFLQHRQASGATGPNWLFFGSRHRATDFLYEDELTSWVQNGVLTRLDLAFSRDQEQKEYVQTRMLEQATEVFRWLQDGAYIYACGEADQMAADVERVLLNIIATQHSVDEAGAREYLDGLILAKRYLRDVY
jgi:sulfite reductase (NADPH) flavoprotein alpha-component